MKCKEDYCIGIDQSVHKDKSVDNILQKVTNKPSMSTLAVKSNVCEKI